LKKIIFESKLELRYEIISENILIFLDGSQQSKMTMEQIEFARNQLLYKIKNVSSKDGAFSIPSLTDFLCEFTNGEVLKSASKTKADVKMVVYDSKTAKEAELSYSIKSSLGSPSTILNASNNTNFKYEVKNISNSDIAAINAINSSKKLLDRIKLIDKLGGVIKFHAVLSETFEYNLQMVDSKMPEYLGNALLYSYINNNKDLYQLFVKSNNFEDSNFAIKKLGDLLSAISFGLIPGTKWDGTKVVTGGLIVIREDGEVYILDLVYYEEAVRKYLINQSKLDSPSSTRYKMLELFEEDGKIYFTLNLQIRYKK